MPTSCSPPASGVSVAEESLPRLTFRVDEREGCDWQTRAMTTESVGDYWNHNTAYHPWLMSIAKRIGGDVLDVGCGDGLLAARLATVSRSVTGIEPDPSAAHRARRRLRNHGTVKVLDASFEAFDPDGRRFDLITFVATLHHLDLRTALARARELLTPSGEIAVVGLSANRTVWDWAWSACCLPAVIAGSRLHHETPDIGVVVAEPVESLRDIRCVASDLLPGTEIRRRLYYRYSLHWRQ